MGRTKINDQQTASLNACGLSKSADLTGLAANVWTSFLWDTEDYDPNNMHSTTSNTERIVIKESGLYDFGLEIRFVTAVTSGGLKIARFNSSGVNQRGGAMNFYSSSINILNIHSEYYLNAGDYLVAQYFQNQAGQVVTSNTGAELESQARFWVSMKGK